VGNAYYYGWGFEKDNKEAVRWWFKAAEQGNPSAQFCLGLAYHNGEGVKRDYREAIMWYQKAADHGNASAQLHMAIAYHNGEGVERDDAAAIKWLNTASDQGRVDFESKGNNADAQEDLDYGDTAVQIIFGPSGK
jgi:hypothetical protein